MDFSQDHYALFGLPRQYALDSAKLASRYREIMAQVHPDKHAHLSDTEQRLALQWTSRINEAYQVLSKPLSRAKYLLSLAGVDVDQGTQMSGEFLLQQMEMRETVAEARSAGDVGKLEVLHGQLLGELAAEYAALERGLAVDSAASVPAVQAGATKLLRQLMFQEKLLQEIDDALSAAEA